MLGSKVQREDVAPPSCALVVLFTWDSFRATSILVKRRLQDLDGHSLRLWNIDCKHVPTSVS